MGLLKDGAFDGVLLGNAQEIQPGAGNLESLRKDAEVLLQDGLYEEGYLQFKDRAEENLKTTPMNERKNYHAYEYYFAGVFALRYREHEIESGVQHKEGFLEGLLSSARKYLKRAALNFGGGEKEIQYKSKALTEYAISHKDNAENYENFLKSAIKTAPLNLTARDLLGQHYIEQGKFEEALEQYQFSGRTSAGNANPYIYYQMGLSQEGMGDTARATGSYKRAQACYKACTGRESNYPHFYKLEKIGGLIEDAFARVEKSRGPAVGVSTVIIQKQFKEETVIAPVDATATVSKKTQETVEQKVASTNGRAVIETVQEQEPIEWDDEVFASSEKKTDVALKKAEGKVLDLKLADDGDGLLELGDEIPLTRNPNDLHTLNLKEPDFIKAENQPVIKKPLVIARKPDVPAYLDSDGDDLLELGPETRVFDKSGDVLEIYNVKEAFDLGQRHLRNGDLSQAMKQYRKAIAHPDSGKPENEGVIAKAKKLLSSGAQFSPEKYRLRGDQYVVEGKLEKARAEYNKILKFADAAPDDLVMHAINQLKNIEPEPVERNNLKPPHEQTDFKNFVNNEIAKAKLQIPVFLKRYEENPLDHVAAGELATFYGVVGDAEKSKFFYRKTVEFCAHKYGQGLQEDMAADKKSVQKSVESQVAPIVEVKPVNAAAKCTASLEEKLEAYEAGDHSFALVSEISVEFTKQANETNKVEDFQLADEWLKKAASALLNEKLNVAANIPALDEQSLFI